MYVFAEWLADEHPFLFYSTLFSLGLVALFTMIFVIMLATHGFWLPLVAAISVPPVRAAFLYARFKNKGETE